METFLVRKVKEQERWKMTEKNIRRLANEIWYPNKSSQEKGNRENRKNEIINKITQGNFPELK